MKYCNTKKVIKNSIPKYIMFSYEHDFTEEKPSFPINMQKLINILNISQENPI